MDSEELIAKLHCRNFVPTEVGRELNKSPMMVLLRVYDECHPHDPDEERSFVTQNPLILRNTAINSLIGRGEITEDKIAAAIAAHQQKQLEFYQNWKIQQALMMLKEQKP